MLVETNQQNLKYLQCRLDFNEYYQIQEQKAANLAQMNRRQGGESGDLDLDELDDEDDEDDEEDDDDEEEEDEEDEEDDDQN